MSELSLFELLYDCVNFEDQYVLDERAAVYQFDGNYSQTDAEALAAASFTATAIADGKLQFVFAAEATMPD